MEQSNHDLKEVIGKTLDQYSSSTSFNDIWSEHQKKANRSIGKRKIFSIPVIAMITVLALFTMGFAGYQIARRVDNTDYPFVDDSRVIGRWQAVDFVKNIDDFSTGNKNWKGDLYLTQLAFVKEGMMLFSTIEGNGNLTASAFTWTKDLIINKIDKTASKYVIKEMDGATYLFFEWKSGDYSFRGMVPQYYVMKRGDTLDYSGYVTPVIEDNVDYPFVDDVQVLGRWESVDFVKSIEDFQPDEKNWLGDLFLSTFDISQEGKMEAATESGPTPEGFLNWTQGLILNKSGKTASKYEIKEINGDTYMFFEWKSGDYTLRGMKPYYYVLKKSQ